MKKFIFVITLLAGIGSWSIEANAQSAAVAPYYDSIEKIQTVLASYPLSGQTASPIKSIKAVDHLKYQVIAGKCAALVTLEAHTPDHPGKTAYTVLGSPSVSCLPGFGF